jgi:uncharacterized protein
MVCKVIVMPAVLSYPGVYIEEIPSGVRTITGVKTSVTAFLGYTKRGCTNKAVQLFNFGDFERSFGGLDPESDLSYAVQQYFLNGGSEAWVVRVASNAARASIVLRNECDGIAMDVLKVEAKSEGNWGNNLRLDVDYDTSNPKSTFNLTVTEYVEKDGILRPEISEVHRNLSMNSISSDYAVDKVNAGSSLIRVSRLVSQSDLDSLNPGYSQSGSLASTDLAKIDGDHNRLAIIINDEGPYEFDILSPNDNIVDLSDLASRISSGISNHFPSQPISCTPQSNSINISLQNGGEKSSVRFYDASMRNASQILKLGINNGGTEVDSVANIRPAQTGTVGGTINIDMNSLPDSSFLYVNIFENLNSIIPDIQTQNLWDSTSKPKSLEEIRSKLAIALSNCDQSELKDASVTLVDDCIRVVAGGTNSNRRLTFGKTNPTLSSDISTDLNLSVNGISSNISRYSLGIGKPWQAQASPIPGFDGSSPGPTNFIGSRGDKNGLYALENVDLFNILCIPNESNNTVLSEALAYCEERRAILIIDLPENYTLPEAEQWLKDNASLRSRNAVAYFPRIVAQDPQMRFRLRPFAACGAIAGIYSRTDGERGVWKAPAGIDAVLKGVQSLSYILTDKENGVLNPLGLNCLRVFPSYGPVIWGARTLRGSDQLVDEYKYIPVRRLALFIEESLYRGTQWVVFEPNDEPLWSQIRLNIGAFMHDLFRQGAFQGTTPKDAYFVKCDRETTTQNDIDRGIVNILIGFAPLKPAEFVVIKLQQKAGEIQT